MHRELEIEINELFASLFTTHSLVNTFLEERGISPDKRWRVGYCTTDFIKTEIDNRPEFPNPAESKALFDTGLYVIADDGRAWSRFDRRVVFPIRDLTGETVGFGGRAWPEASSKTAKYINSPTSLLFRKAETLYGLYENLDSIKHKREVILVEGYMDVLAMVQMGFVNTVAICGTALSKHGAHMLRLLGASAHILMDGDSAGKEAAEKIALTLKSQGLRYTTHFLPVGKDPADMISCKEEIWNLLCRK